MRVGIYGGSFNPIHMGHLLIAEYVREEMKLDKIFFIPVGIPSHRLNDLVIPDYRIEMVKRACSTNKNFEVLDIEMKEEKTSYTYDTLVKLKNIYPEYEFYEIIGEDSADYLHTWKNYEKMLEMTKFIVLKREKIGYQSQHENIIVLDSPEIDISSGWVRERIKEGKSIKYSVHEQVERFIQEKKLYIK